MPKNIANRVCCQPKNSPAAAINLMSPPPNAPGIARQSSSIGTLMHTMPMSAPANRAGESSRLSTASTATAALSRLGISWVSASISAMLSSTPQSARARSPCHRMPNSPSPSV